MLVTQPSGALSMSLTQKQIDNLKPQAKPYNVADGDNLFLRVGTNGNKRWQFRYRFNGRQCTLSLGNIAAKDARALANKARVALQEGVNPSAAKAEAKKTLITLGEFAETEYYTHLKARQKNADSELTMLRSEFKWLWNKPLATIERMDLVKWQNKRAQQIKIASVNRYTNCIKAVTKLASDNELCADPLAKFKRMPKVDVTHDIRFLTEHEEKELLRALERRDSVKLRRTAKIIERTEKNGITFIKAQREQKRHALDRLFYGDHLSPIVLLMLNTGLRRKEALRLKWTDIRPSQDGQYQIFVSPDSDKSRKGRFVPLHDEAANVLRAWSHDQEIRGITSEWIFPNKKTEKPFKEIKSSWTYFIEEAAKSCLSLKGLTLRDLRSTFGSKLVQKGVPILQVSKLLGHSSVVITEKHYASLSDEGARSAIETLKKFNSDTKIKLVNFRQS